MQGGTRSLEVPGGGRVRAEKNTKWQKRKLLYKLRNKERFLTDHVGGGSVVVHILKNRDQLKFCPAGKSNMLVKS